MKRSFLFCLAILITLCGLNSCLVPKKVVYIKDMSPDVIYKIAEEPLSKLQESDRIQITVSAKTPELAIPFNQQSGLYSVNEQGNITVDGTGAIKERGYLIDQNGNIQFPILGSLKVAGLTVNEVEGLIKNSLEARKLITEPFVKVELLNMKVMVMGEIGRVGILDAPEGKLNLLEAITRSGGVKSNGLTKEICVIREEAGQRRMYVNNIESVELFDSPVYHLQQNDIIYIKPRSGVSTPREDMSWRYITYFTSVITLGISVLTLIKR